MKTVRLLLLAAAMAALAACYPPVTSHPVGSTSGLKPDPVLDGLWKGQPHDTSERGVYFHFLPRPDGTITLITVATGDKPDADWDAITMTTGRAGNNRFMNIRLVSDNGKPEKDPPAGTIPVLYRLDAKGQMTIWLTDENATKDAIKSGKLKGTIGKGDYGDAVITADPATLDRFMASPAGRALYPKPFFTLKRME
jgi:hypothetical protein